MPTVMLIAPPAPDVDVPVPSSSCPLLPEAADPELKAAEPEFAPVALPPDAMLMIPLKPVDAAPLITSMRPELRPPPDATYTAPPAPAVAVPPIMLRRPPLGA